MTNNSLMWFRYDLRVDDNAALFEACYNKICLPIFILDDGYLKLKTTSDFHLNFIKDSLLDLNLKFKEKFNTKLNFYKGNTVEIIDSLINKYSIKSIYSNKIFKGDYFKNLDKRISLFLKEKGVEWKQKNQFGIQLHKRVRGKWSSDWHKFVNSPTSPKILNFKFNEDDSNELSIDYSQLNCQKGGESNAIECLNSFLEDRHKGYSKKMSSPLTAEDSCSRLSPHLSFGTISIKSIIHRIKNSINKKEFEQISINSFKKRLAWHCHFIQKLYDEPRIEYENLHPLYNGLREDKFDFNYYTRWKNGTTGYPFLDACMFQNYGLGDFFSLRFTSN